MAGEVARRPKPIAKWPVRSILLEVVVAAFLSYLILQDALSPYTIAGGALILVGAFIAARGEERLLQPAASGLISEPKGLPPADSQRGPRT